MNRQTLKKHKFLTIAIILIFVLVIIFLIWQNRVENEKSYANGAIQEYARM